MEAAAPAAPTTASLRAAAQANDAQALVVPGFGNSQSFHLLQRQATMLSQTSIVPAAYRALVVKYYPDGNEKSRVENPNAVSNCIVAMNMAVRMNADPVMVCQNLNIIDGKPSWSAQWITAEINNSGKFSGLLKYEMKELGDKDVEYTESIWGDGQKKPTEVVKSLKVFNMSCRAWAIEKLTGERIQGPMVTIEMAVKEGWYTKKGSKWKTMPELMMENRAASFFGKKYIPERLMGLPSTEEALDIIDITPQADGSHAADLNELRREAESMRQNATPKAAQPASARQAPDDVQDVEATDVARPSIAKDGLKEPNTEPTQQPAQEAAAPEAAAPDTVVRSKDFDHALMLAEKGDLDEALDFANSLAPEEREEISIVVRALRNQDSAEPAAASSTTQAAGEAPAKATGRPRPQRSMNFD